ncbi:hypothetical protein ACWCPX_32895 [Streptomyces olivaceoviridis]
MAVVDLDEQQRRPALRGCEDDVGLGTALARPFCVPVAGSETSVQYEAMVPIPGGASTAAWAAARTSADSLVSLARFGFGRSIAITVSLTAIGWEAPLEPGITVSSLLRAVWFVVGDL